MSRIVLAMMAVALVASPALAAPIVVSAPVKSFRSLEFDYQGQTLIDAARRRLAAALPVGTSLEQARAVLHSAGAACDRGGAEPMHCTANQLEAVEDTLHDVVWTVDVSHADDRVTGISVARRSIGS